MSDSSIITIILALMALTFGVIAYICSEYDVNSESPQTPREQRIGLRTWQELYTSTRTTLAQ